MEIDVSNGVDLVEATLLVLAAFGALFYGAGAYALWQISGGFRLLVGIVTIVLIIAWVF